MHPFSIGSTPLDRLDLFQLEDQGNRIYHLSELGIYCTSDSKMYKEIFFQTGIFTLAMHLLHYIRKLLMVYNLDNS
jgi:hypothetical protein